MIHEISAEAAHPVQEVSAAEILGMNYVVDQLYDIAQEGHETRGVRPKFKEDGTAYWLVGESSVSIVCPEANTDTRTITLSEVRQTADGGIERSETFWLDPDRPTTVVAETRKVKGLVATTEAHHEGEQVCSIGPLTHENYKTVLQGLKNMVAESQIPATQRVARKFRLPR